MVIYIIIKLYLNSEYFSNLPERIFFGSFQLFKIFFRHILLLKHR